MTTVTLRTTTQTGATNKGEALTHAELDANFLFDQSGSSSTTRTLQEKAREWISPEDKGAAGDGSTDDSTAFAALVTDSDAGSVIRLKPGKTYKLVGNWTISKALTIIAYGATLSWASDTTANRGVVVTASNVKWYGGELDGPQHATSVSNQTGIRAYGADSSTYISGIVIQDAKIHDFGDSAISLLFVQDFYIGGDTVAYDCYSNGIQMLSCKRGKVITPYVYDIVGDSVVGTEVYGITASKNNGSEATYPVCTDIIIANATVKGVITWNGIDTHGGNRIKIVNNNLIDCRRPIHMGPYTATAGQERAPTNCSVISNTCVNTGTIAAADASHGVIINGDSATTTRANGNKVDANIVDGYGDSNSTVGNDGAITLQYAGNSTANNNIIKNSGRHAVLIASSTGFECHGNNIDTISGTASGAASGTITFSANPTAGDTITINGRVFTFQLAPAGNWEILLDATTLATTLASAVTQLNGDGSKDGRVWLATYTANATVLTITHDAIGQIGNNFTLAASVATVSGATLSSGTSTDGTSGSAGIHIRNLSGGGASTGSVKNNTFNIGAYVCMQMVDDNTSVSFDGNTSIGTGPLYDLQGSSAVPNSGAGNIADIPPVRVTYDPGDIAANGTEDFYVPIVGCNASTFMAWTHSSRSLDDGTDGLTMTPVASDNFVRVRLYNPAGGACNIGSTTFITKCEKQISSAVALAP